MQGKSIMFADLQQRIEGKAFTVDQAGQGFVANGEFMGTTVARRLRHLYTA